LEAILIENKKLPYRELYLEKNRSIFMNINININNKLDCHKDLILKQSAVWAFKTTMVALVATYFLGSSGFANVPPFTPDVIFGGPLSGSFETIELNLKPVADAGTDMVVFANKFFDSKQNVLLVGERSFDLDGRIVSAEWTQAVGDPTVFFAPQQGLNQPFLPPAISTETNLFFQLKITDNNGAVSFGGVNVRVVPFHLQVELFEPQPTENELSLYLLDQYGFLIDQVAVGITEPLEPLSVFTDLGAGVYYVIAAAEIPTPMELKISASGVNLSFDIDPAVIAASDFPFITPTMLAEKDMIGFLPFAHDGKGAPDLTYQHPQIIEILMPNAKTSLRDPDHFLDFLNHSSIRYQEDAATAEAYYRAVDPLNERTTLDDYLAKHKDAVVEEASATYQNDADLGFGREMHMQRIDDGSVVSWVRNFPSLEHAILKTGLIATVAMEFSDPQPGLPSKKYTKFFVYGPDGERLLSADLDGRGQKFVPGLCNVCHGGAPKAAFVTDNGEVIYPDNGDTNAQFLPWDLDTFKYSENLAHNRSNQEADFYALNQMAKSTWPANPGIVGGNRWTGAAGHELVDGWYAGGQQFSGDFVPAGWNNTPEQRALYLEVVAPNCRACHVTRGTNNQHAIDFSTYDKFMGFAPLIKELVYKQGVMPLASRTFGHFWDQRQPTTAAWKLANMLPENTDLFLPNGDVIKPGRAIPQTGTASDAPPNVVPVQTDMLGIVLDGRNSPFAPEQDWLVVSKDFFSETTTLLGNQAVTVPAIGDDDVDGTNVRMVRQITSPVAVKRTLIQRRDLRQSNGSTDDRINYFFHILKLLQNDCTTCHSPTGTFGIPVFFDDSGDILLRYRDLIDRINFEFPTQSLLLTKAAGLRHGRNTGTPDKVFGAAINGWELFKDEGLELLPISQRGSAAQTSTHWIAAGAPFWGDTSSLKTLVCQNLPQTIPDNDAVGLIDVVNIGPAQIISRIILELELDHTSFSDLEVTLTHLKTGKSVSLFNRPVGSDGVSCNITELDSQFTDSGVGTLQESCDAPGGANFSIKPDSPLSLFTGDLLNGEWQLTVRDHTEGGTGTLQNWCIRHLRSTN